jgi:methionyl-tRNA formyltransferase
MSRVKADPEAIREVTDYVEKKEYQTMFERLLRDIDKTVAARKKAEAKNLIFEKQIQADEQRIQAAEQRAAELERRLREAGLQP